MKISGTIIINLYSYLVSLLKSNHPIFLSAFCLINFLNVWFIQSKNTYICVYYTYICVYITYIHMHICIIIYVYVLYILGTLPVSSLIEYLVNLFFPYFTFCIISQLACMLSHFSWLLLLRHSLCSWDFPGKRVMQFI